MILKSPGAPSRRSTIRFKATRASVMWYGFWILMTSPSILRKTSFPPRMERISTSPGFSWKCEICWLTMLEASHFKSLRTGAEAPEEAVRRPWNDIHDWLGKDSPATWFRAMNRITRLQAP